MKLGVVLTWQNHEADWARYESGEFSRPPAIADWKVYEENRYLGDLVEPLGFDSLFAVEHHMTPHHMTGSALGILTYFAGRTERIDLGTCLIVPPWHHPVRVAEDVCFLDNLLKGRRLWLGIGRGASPREYQGLGIDQGESRDRFAEGVDILRLALTRDCFSYSGKHYHLPQVTVRPRPYTPGLADRLYAGVVTGPSLSITANLGNVHVDHLVALVNPGDMSAADAEASIRLFAKEVIPAARKIQPAKFADGGDAATRTDPAPET